MRLLSPDDKCMQVDAPSGLRYAGTVLDVTSPGDAKALRAAGYTPGDTSGAPVRRGGFDCAECGFRGFFRRCSRCGSTS